MKSYEPGSKRFDALTSKGVTHWVPANSARALAANIKEGQSLARDLLVDHTTDDATALIEWAQRDTTGTIRRAEDPTNGHH